MKSRISSPSLGLAFAAILLAVSAANARAAADASVYVVHGIPGEDAGLPHELPVDVHISGLGCVLPDFKFGQIVGPVSIPAGSYDITIRLADLGNPCGGPVAIGPATVPFAAGENASVVAYLTADGKPTAGKFINDVSPTGRGKARLIAHHAAAAPAVDVTVRRDEPGSPGLTIPDFENGDQARAEVRPGGWNVTIAPAGTGMAVFGPAHLQLQPFNAYLVFAVGSLPNTTFTLLIKNIPGLK